MSETVPQLAPPSEEMQPPPRVPFFDRANAKNRIVVKDQISFRDFSNNGDSQSYTVGWSYEVESKEQPWIRRSSIQRSDGHKILELGWLLHDCGLLIIHNLETEKTAGKLIMYVSHLRFAEIPPKHEIRLRPVNVEDFKIATECESPVKFVVRAYPK